MILASVYRFKYHEAIIKISQLCVWGWKKIEIFDKTIIRMKYIFSLFRYSSLLSLIVLLSSCGLDSMGVYVVPDSAPRALGNDTASSPAEAVPMNQDSIKTQTASQGPAVALSLSSFDSSLPHRFSIF